ncbi:hypothetical protein [Streptomyces sp. NPDC059564]|uniref:hypothetical protein n=1 Tax=Streptomyces sp. NPDC059564 TaxID=3346865 RepID=UPI0036CDE469
MFRADGLDGLAGRGWTTPAAYGVGTAIDLRNHDGAGVDHTPRPAGPAAPRSPLDEIGQRYFRDVW